MDRRRASLVDAFTDEPFAGAPAAVVPDADGLSPSQLRTIAGGIAPRETAFVTETGAADVGVRVVGEGGTIDRCDHATIACLARLRAAEELAPGAHTVDTPAGIVDATIEDDGVAWLTRELPSVRELGAVPDRVAEAFGIDPVAVDVADLPIARVAGQRPVLVVPVTYLEHLGSAVPDQSALEDLDDEFDVAGVFAFTFDTLSSEATLHGRAWDLRGGLRERAGDGAGSCGVATYLRVVGAFDVVPDEMLFEVGDFLDRPARLRIRLGSDVRIGGLATTVFEGRIVVPTDDDGDDIIEA